MSNVNVRAYAGTTISEQYIIIEGTNQTNEDIIFSSWGFDLTNGKQMVFAPNRGGVITEPFWSDPIHPGGVHKFFIPINNIRNAIKEENLDSSTILIPRMTASSVVYKGNGIQFT